MPVTLDLNCPGQWNSCVTMALVLLRTRTPSHVSISGSGSEVINVATIYNCAAAAGSPAPIPQLHSPSRRDLTPPLALQQPPPPPQRRIPAACGAERPALSQPGQSAGAAGESGENRPRPGPEPRCLPPYMGAASRSGARSRHGSGGCGDTGGLSSFSHSPDRCGGDQADQLRLTHTLRAAARLTAAPAPPNCPTATAAAPHTHCTISLPPPLTEPDHSDTPGAPT